ncbi:MAG: histidine--tRNA ligase [Bacteroidota bacterium]
MKPSIPKGTRDFLPQQVNRRNYIFNTIRQVFIKYGYQAIETPVMEKLDTLTGKYGEEGDRLLFKVLNNGDYLKKANQEALDARNSNQLTSSISKRGLRYDLTVPFARFVVMHQNDLSFPFKRYQIQPVWRADRPQKGRYQEFYQCDVDVVGSKSLSYEAELVQIYDEVFSTLKIQTVTRINNRKVLAGIADVAGIPDQMIEMTVAIDKLDKIGIEGVRKELDQRGISAEAIATIERILAIKELDQLKTALSTSETGLLGVEEIMTVMNYLDGYEIQNRFEFDITLARGLSYYTGCIFEANVDTTAHPTIKMGSIGGGGRYEDLTSMFGMRDMSGVGVSFGAERIYDVLEELDLFPSQDAAALKVLLIAFDQQSHLYAFRCLNKLRAAGINADLYPDPVKLNKQMKYANERQVPYTIVIGDNEMESGQLALKDMQNREQELLSLDDIIIKLKA